MYDAAGAATADAVVKAADSQPIPDQTVSDTAESGPSSSPHHDDVTIADVGPYGSKAEAHLDAAAHENSAKPITEIIFVDSRLPDIQSLTPRDGTQIIVLDASKDGITQVSETLAGRDGITAIHFVGHGESGEFIVGGTRINAETLSQRSSDIAAWNAALTDSADLMIWGCDVGAQAAGQALLNSLASLTGADVAASTDRTGATQLGGDWTLEATSGDIEATNPFDAASLAAWDHLLAPPTITGPSGTPLTVAEPSSLNAPGADSASLAGWEFNSDVNGNVTVTATVGDTSVGRLLNGSGFGAEVAGGWTFTGTLAEANAWLDALTFQAADVERGNGAGKTNIVLSISDADGASTNRSIAVEVTPSNDPTIINDHTANIVEGAASTVIDQSILNAIDPEVGIGTQNASQIVYRLTDDPDFGYLTLNGQRIGVGSIFTQQDVIDGKLSYVHTGSGANQNTPDGFSVSVNDGATPQAASDTARITLDITPVNQAPNVSGGGAVYEGQPANATNGGVPQSIVGNFITADGGGDPGDADVRVRLTSLPTHGALYFTGVAVVNGVTRTFNNHQVTAADIADGFVFDYAARSGLTYANDGVDGANGRPPNDSFGVEVTDNGGGQGTPLSSQTTINLTIRPVNDDPTWVDGSTQQATVPAPTGNAATDYKVTLTTGMINVTDVDSSPENLTFKVTSQAGLDQGRLVYVNGGTSYFLPEGATFTLADVQAGRIQYWQMAGASAGQTDSFTFQVVDNALGPRWNPDGTQFERVGGIYTDPTSAGTLRNFTFTINLAETPDGTDANLPDRNTTTSNSSSNFAGTDPSGTSFGSLLEGGTVTLTNGSGGLPGLNYTAEGVDPSQVVYTIRGFDGAGPDWNGQLQKLVNGEWVTLSVYDTFTQADLNDGNVRFQHDGGEDFESSVRLQASAGVVENGAPASWDTSFTFYIKPVNDAPVATGSSTTVIDEGDTVAITTGQLNFGDADDATSESYLENGATLPGVGGDNFAFNNGDQLTFKVTSLPTNGKLQYRDDNGTWQDVTTNTVLQTSWITNDTGTTRMRYVHDGGEGRNDTFQVQATDRWGATSNTASVGFVITNVNDAPQIAPKPIDADPTGPLPGTATPGVGANQPLTVIQEGSYTQITSAMLQAIDSDSSAQQVQYRITQAPAHGRIAYSVDGINFVTIGVGSSFTQADVAAGRIYYLSGGDEPSGSAYPGTPDDKFTFTLADGAAEQVGNEFWIYVQPTNDAPVVTAPTGPIPVTDTLTGIPGFSVTDPDLVTLIPGETDFLQVTIRLTHADGTAFTAADYAALGGVQIDVNANGATIDADHDGSNDYLVLRGTRDQINAALGTLELSFGSDRDTTYQVQVIADDRVRDVATGALLDRDADTAGLQPGGNGGGTLNEPETPFTGTPTTVLATEYNWYVDAVPTTGAIIGNIAAASVTVRASSVNDPATLTSGNNAATTFEDQPTRIGDQINFNIEDAESAAFGTPVTVTLTVPSGSLGLGTDPNVTVSGRNTGTLTLTGTAAQIEALLNASLTYTSASNVNGDLNGGADGDVTLTVSFSDSGSNWGTGQAANNPADLAIALTITPVNDAPTVSAGSGTLVVDGPTAVPGFSVGDIDLSGDGGIADGEADFVQVTVRVTTSGGAPLSAAQHQNVNISSTSAPGEGATFEIDNTYDGDGSALVIRGTRDQVNAYLAGLQVEFTGSLANSDSTYRVEVVADDRVRDVATGTLQGGANGGMNNNGGDGTTAVPTTAINPYAAVPAGLTANVARNSRALFLSDFNDPAHIDLSGALITPEGTGSGVVQLGGIVVTDSDALNDTLTATVTLPSGFNIVSVNGSTSYPGAGTGSVTITGSLSQINAALNSIRIQLPDVSGAPTAADWNGQFDVTIVVNDGGNNGGRPASLPGDTNDPTANPGDFDYADGTSAALVTTRTFTFTVTPVNDAPQVIGEGTEVLTPVNEDVNGPAGQTVGDLFGGQFGDPRDPIPGGSSSNSFAGVAVTGLTTNAAQGAWQYYNGTSWVDVGTRTASTALILSADTLVRFVPAADFHGTPQAMTVRLVETGDGGNGSAVPATGTQVDLSGANATGGITRYSAGTVMLSTSVINVNDRPTLGNGTLPSVPEDTVNPSGSTVGGLFGGGYSDATDNQTAIAGGGNAATSFGGIAIVGNSATAEQGSWQYSLDGNSWSTIGAGVSDTSALLLPTNALVRFVPAADYNGTPGSLTIRGADSTVTFSASADISATVNDQTSTWSVTRTLNTNVDPRNDAPVLSGDVSNPTVTENDEINSGNSVPPTKLVNAGTVSLSDIDLSTTPALGTTVFGAGTITVSLGASYRNGDVLFVDGTLPNGVNASFDNTNGTLTITLDGDTTIADVQQLVEQVSYRNTSDDPTNGGADTTRNYTITVSDGNNAQPGGNAGGATPLTAAPLTGTITIIPTNDPPTAVDDVNAISEGTVSVGGNVVTGTNGVGEDTDPDSPVLTVTDISFGGTGHSVGVEFAATYGWLTLNADGSYTYRLDNDNPAVNALKDGETLTEVFDYTIDDGSGLTASAKLTITINGETDGAPAIVPVDVNGAADGQAEVYEHGLTDSTGKETTTGAITVTAADGLSSISVGGRDITLAELQNLGTTPITIDTDEGLLTLTGFAATTDVGGVPTSGTLNYSYTLKAALPNGTQSLDTVALTVTDAGGDTNNGTLTVRIIDDVPVARDDAAEIVEDTDQVSGNVVIGSGPGDVPDTIGADGESASGAVTDVSFAGTSQGVGTRFATTYGWLTLNADGSYTYELNNADPTVNALKVGETLTETVRYTITDSDGDDAAANLTITILGNTDGAPSITPVDGNGSATGEAEVHEGGLTDPSDNSETTTGAIDVTATDGLSSVTIGGTTVSLAQLNNLGNAPVTIDTGEGLLTLTGFTVGSTVGGVPTSGTLSYSYTLKAAQEQPAATESIDTIALTVTDAGGIATDGTLTVRIIDDVPVARDDVAEINEDDTSVGGNVITGAGPQDVADSLGADGSALGGPITDVSFDGTAQTVGTRFATAYGWLTLNADGSYTYELDNSHPAVSALKQGATLTESVSYVIADGDGDSATATLSIIIRGTNDAPTNVVGAELPDRTNVDSDNVGPVDVTGAFSDVDIGDKLTYTATGLPPGLTLDPDTGLITGRLDTSASQDGPAQDGVYTVTVTVTDENGETASQTFEWKVTNPPPVANDDTNTTNHDTSVGGNIITGNGAGAGRDTDPDGDSLTVTEIDGVPLAPDGTSIRGSGGGTFTVRPDGTYTFNPGSDFQNLTPGSSATTTITYTIVDADGATATAKLTITVNGPPVAPPAPSTNIDKGTVIDVRGTPGYLEGEQVHRYTDPGQTLSQQLTFYDRGTQTGVYFYEARMQGELPLPYWISFDPSTRTVTARPDSSVQPGIYIVRVVARDAAGRQAVSMLTIHVMPENIRGQGAYGVRSSATSTHDQPSSPGEAPQVPQVAPVTPQDNSGAPSPTDPQSVAPTPQLPPQIPPPDNTTPAPSPIDAPDYRRLSPQQNAEAEALLERLANAQGLVVQDGAKTAASLTKTLHGLGSTGRMIEAARILESLAADHPAGNANLHNEI